MKHKFEPSNEEIEKFISSGKSLFQTETVLNKKLREIKELEEERCQLLLKHNSVVVDLINRTCHLVTDYRNKQRDVKLISFHADMTSVSLPSLSVINVPVTEVYDLKSGDCLVNILEQCILSLTNN